MTDDGQETIVQENELPHVLLQARPAYRQPGYRAVRGELNGAKKARGFFGPRRGAVGREQGPRKKRSSIAQLQLRTGCARCRKIGHWARECPEGNRGQRNDERYDRRAERPEDGSKRFVALAGPTARSPFFFGASWTFVALDPGEVMWDTGAQEGLIGRQQLERWGKRLAEHGLQFEWSKEKPEPASGIGGTAQPIGVTYMPVGLLGCTGVVRYTVVETLKSGHTAIRADQFGSEGWRLPEDADSHQSTDKGIEPNLFVSHRPPLPETPMHERHQIYHDYTGRGQ